MSFSKNIGVGNVIFSVTVLHIVLRINSLVILTAHCWHTSKGAAPHHQALTILCKIILVTLPRDNAQCNNTGFYDVVIVKITLPTPMFLLHSPVSTEPCSGEVEVPIVTLNATKRDILMAL